MPQYRVSNVITAGAEPIRMERRMLDTGQAVLSDLRSPAFLSRFFSYMCSAAGDFFVCGGAFNGVIYT